MKLFAHRGWSAGGGENTIEAFKKSVEAGIDGIEFDVRYGIDGKSIVVIHNPAKDADVLTLEDALMYLKDTSLELLIEFKVYDGYFYAAVSDLIQRHQLEERSTFFAFPHIASKFPWDKPRVHKLGVIAPLPQDIGLYAKAYNPDMILMGWGTKKQRFMFKSVWTLLSLSKAIQKHNLIKFVIGVAYSKEDVSWLSRQTNLYGFTIDNPNIHLQD